VLEYCVAKGAKLIYSGSSSTFGNNGADANLSPYAFLKMQNIKLIENYGEWFGLKYAIAYFYNVRSLEKTCLLSIAHAFCTAGLWPKRHRRGGIRNRNWYVPEAIR
jgi:hypothetical protein